MLGNQSKILKEDIVCAINVLRDIGFDLPPKILILGGSGFIGNWMVGVIYNFITENKSSAKLFIQTSRSSQVKNTWQDESLNTVANFLETIPLGVSFDLIIDLRLPETGNSEKEQLAQSKSFYKYFFQGLTHLNPGGILIIPSSGAIYGNLKNNNTPLCEDIENFAGFNQSIYGQTKLNLEELGEKIANQETKIIMPRIFSSFGPLMRADSPLIGNIVIKQAIESKQIELNAPFGVFRDFIYITDLITQILALTLIGKNFINLNIGSHEIYEINSFATRVAYLTGAGYRFQNSEKQNDNYYPCLHQIEGMLPKSVLVPTLNFETHLIKTIDFYRN